MDAKAAFEAREAVIRAAAAKANEQAIRQAAEIDSQEAATKAISEQCIYGSIEIVPNFDPDPLVIRGISGGDLDAGSLNAGCAGWITELPNHVMITPVLPSKLRLVISSEEDTTLVVQRPDGSFQCVDDTEGSNPVVTGDFPEGATKIWVGGRERGERAVYVLGVTGKSGVSTAKVRAIARGREKQRSIYGTISLSPGFAPDPMIFPGITEGQVDASSLDGKCVGWISQTPVQVVELGAAFEKLSFHVSGDEETTLIIQRPDGSYACAGKTAELPAPVLGGEQQGGRYKVWVGASDKAAKVIYRLGLTQSEMSEACSRCKRCELWKLRGTKGPVRPVGI